jgi:hypothetical protein
MTAWPPFNREGAQVRNVLGITLSRDAVFQVMSTVDRNNDGFIEYGEFVRSFGLSGLRKNGVAFVKHHMNKPFCAVQVSRAVARSLGRERSSCQSRYTRSSNLVRSTHSKCSARLIEMGASFGHLQLLPRRHGDIPISAGSRLIGTERLWTRSSSVH